MHGMMHLVMHMAKKRKDVTKAVTVRIPESEYTVLKTYADAYGQSLNMVVRDALAVETAKIRRRAVLDDMAAFQKSLGKRYPSTSVDDIRDARLERMNHLVPDKDDKEETR